MDEDIELLLTVVLTTTSRQAAHNNTEDLVARVGGEIVVISDCSAEEPGCWAVTVAVPTRERASYHHAAPLARAVRRLVRALDPALTMPRVSCEPPTAWTVLDDPDWVSELVEGGERLLVEAWCGGDPYHLDSPIDLPEDEAEVEPAEQTSQRPTNTESPAPPPRTKRADSPASEQILTRRLGSERGYRLRLRVDVATARSAGAEWQARAVASRISRTATLTEVVEHDGVLSVQIDLGPSVAPPPQTVLTAVSALDRRGWSPLCWDGDTARTRWVADPRPASGITELELSSGPSGKRRRR